MYNLIAKKLKGKGFCSMDNCITKFLALGNVLVENVQSFENRFEYICNSLDTEYTNGFIEGKNNKIKVLKRNAFGVRNFERFRKRILLACG